MVKDVPCVLSQAGDKEKILSPHEELILRSLDLMLCGLVIEHQSTESEGLRFNSLWAIRILFFIPRS